MREHRRGDNKCLHSSHDNRGRSIALSLHPPPPPLSHHHERLVPQRAGVLRFRWLLQCEGVVCAVTSRVGGHGEDQLLREGGVGGACTQVPLHDDVVGLNLHAREGGGVERPGGERGWGREENSK